MKSSVFAPEVTSTTKWKLQANVLLLCTIAAFSLVEISGIKERIGKITTQIEIPGASDSSLRSCLHMRFVGNPETGKTTVARIVGQLMRERDLLSKGQFFEYAGRDFCGQYIGETASKTAAMCRDVYGWVLFIDEA